MKTGCTTILSLTFLITMSFYGYGCSKHSKQTDSLLNLIHKTEHNDLRKTSHFANQLLKLSKHKEAVLYGRYYLAKAHYSMYNMQNAIEQLDSIYNEIENKKYNYIKYEIDLIIGDHYFSQDDFEAGLKRLKNILTYSSYSDFKTSVYISQNASYINSERALEDIQNNIKMSAGKYSKKAYWVERLKLSLLKLQLKHKDNFDYKRGFDRAIERAITHGWTDLAIENLHSKIYTYGHTEELQLNALNTCDEAIALAKQMGNNNLLTVLYNTRGHININLSDNYLNKLKKLKNDNIEEKFKNSQIEELEKIQRSYLEASYQSYEQGLRCAHIQKNNVRLSRLYSCLGGVQSLQHYFHFKAERLDSVCTLYNCAFNELKSINFETIKILKGRIISSCVHFGMQPCLGKLGGELNALAHNNYVGAANFSNAKANFENAFFEKDNQYKINQTKDTLKKIRYALLFLIPLLLLSLVYYYRQKYLMLKQIEKQSLLIQAQNKSLKQAVRRLERANRGLENFAFTAAHDIKSPLRSIASFTGLLKRKYYNPESEDNVLFFDYVIKGCEDLSYFVDNLLKFSTILHRKTPSKEVDLNEVLTKIRHRLRRTLEEEKVCLNIEQNLPLVQAHNSLIYQLFYNLITNSIKFRKQDAPTVIEVGCLLKDKEMAFYVKDNGIGIAPEKQQEVFDLFNKLYANTEYNGFGIGLATCKKIVHHYKGKLWLKSIVDEETSVYFTLPDAIRSKEESPSNIKKQTTKNLIWQMTNLKKG